MEKLSIQELRNATGMSRPDFAAYFGIPYRTIQDWEIGTRAPAEYIVSLMEYKLRNENLIASEEKMTAVDLSSPSDEFGACMPEDLALADAIQKHLLKCELEYIAQKSEKAQNVKWLAPHCDSTDEIARFLRSLGFRIAEIMDEEPWPGEFHRWVKTTSGVIVYATLPGDSVDCAGLVAGSVDKRKKRC